MYLLPALAGMIVLNGLLSIYLWLPDYDFGSVIHPSADFLVLFALMFALSHVSGRGYTAGLCILSALSAFLFVFGTGEAVTLHLYQRSFLPLTDLPFFAEFIRLLFSADSVLQIFLFTSLFCLLFLMVMAVVAVLIVRLTAYMKSLGRPSVNGLILLGALICLTLIRPPDFAGDSLAPSVVRAFSGGESNATEALVTPSHVRPESPAADGETSSDDPRNVLIFIVESYGYTAFAREDHWRVLSPTYEEAQARLRKAGYSILSRFYESPVIGGYSWYADASFLTGTWIDSREKYDALMASDTPSMFSILEGRGYRTALTAPGTLKPWPEGERFYGFDRYLYNVDFGYRGPQFSFVPVPDQFALYRAHGELLNGPVGEGAAPLFAVYILVSSHAPFNRVPYYVEEWDLLRDGSIYHTLPTRTFDNNWFSGNEYTEGYTAAIGYELEVLTGYLVRFIRDDSLVIIFGDHQPKYPVTEKGQPLSVPVHVLSRDAGAIEPLGSSGFSEGLVPDLAVPHPGLDSFFPLFLEMMEVDPQ